LSVCHTLTKAENLSHAFYYFFAFLSRPFAFSCWIILWKILKEWDKNVFPSTVRSLGCQQAGWMAAIRPDYEVLTVKKVEKIPLRRALLLFTNRRKKKNILHIE
jgi:hypothetical protein